MQISTILDHIDSGYMALPQFQRGYVWNRDQVRSLFNALYRRHPVGGLLVWVTESDSADFRGSGNLAPGMVKLLLDGQQRITTIYGVVRGTPPKFFDGNRETFTGLHFHLELQTFEFYQQHKMTADSLWIDLTKFMKMGNDGLGDYAVQLTKNPAVAPKISEYVGRLNKLLGIANMVLHTEEITGADKTLDVVVEIFNNVNSGGTKLSKGDLAIAKICSDWPAGRDKMKQALKKWNSHGYRFTLDWLLRSVNTVLTGEAKFQFLHDKTAIEVEGGLKRAIKGIETCLNLIADRLGLDHHQVLFGRFGIPVMVRFLDQRQKSPSAKERDKLLFWFVQAGMWGRFSGSTESYIDQDLAALEGDGDPLDRLLEQLRLWNGGMRAEARHFSGWSLGTRFYPVLYMLTRMGAARDWGTGVSLKYHSLGVMSRPEVHHIFPKAQLYKLKFSRSEVNAVANFCFQSKETNLEISDRRPEEYFPAFENRSPGGLASQWIPEDPDLWKLKNYREFLDARRILLAAETNRQMAELLHGDLRWLEPASKAMAWAGDAIVTGGITSEAEEEALESLNDWVEAQGLPRGHMAFEYTEVDTAEHAAIFDLAWPDGLQEGLSGPTCLLLNEGSATLALASSAGFRCFTDIKSFKAYLKKDILSESRDA